MLSFAVRKWVAGPTVRDALARAKALQKQGMASCIDVLGEHEGSRGAQKTVREYQRLIAAIRRSRTKADISVKLTALGLDNGFSEAKRNLETILRAAGRVWIDMEGSRYEQDTLRLFFLLQKRFPHLAVTVQANHRDSFRVLGQLLRTRGTVRLVKGAYTEPKRIAFESWTEVNANFVKLMAFLFRRGRRFAIATHDTRMLAAARMLQRRYRRDMEFQVLLGRERIAKKMVQQGFRVRVYVPYGRAWGPYLRRRLQERRRQAVGK